MRSITPRRSVAARRPRLYHERAGLRSRPGRYEEAVGDYDRAIRLNPYPLFVGPSTDATLKTLMPPNHPSASQDVALRAKVSGSISGEGYE